MLRNSGGLSLLRGRLGVQVAVVNHTIDDSLRREGWDVTKRSMPGQGPVTVRHLVRRARKRALSDLNYVQVLSQCFRRRRKRRASDMQTWDHELWWLYLRWCTPHGGGVRHGGAAGPGPCMRHPPAPPPPRVLRDSGLGRWRQRRPLFSAWRQRRPPFLVLAPDFARRGAIQMSFVAT